MPNLPPVNQPVTAEYKGNPAFKAALKDLQEWSDGAKANINEAKRAVSGFKEGLEFARQAMKGFGAVELAKDLLGMAESAWRAAEGMAQFVIDAKEAGAAVEADTLANARALKDEMAALKAEAMGLGAIIVGVFVGDLRTATAEMRAMVEPLEAWVRRLRAAALVANQMRQLKFGGALTEAAMGLADEALGGGGGSAGQAGPGEWTWGGDEDIGGGFTDKSLAEMMGGKEKADRAEAEKLQRETERNQAELQRMADHNMQKALAQADAQAKEQAQEFAHQQRMAKIQTDAAKREAEDRRRQREDKRRTTEEMANTSMRALSTFFAKSKGVAIAEALVNTYTGVSAALRMGPKGIPMAALVLAQGLQNVQRIKGTNVGSEGSGGGGMGGGSGSVPETPEAPQPIEPAKPAAARGSLEIHLIGNVMTPEFTRETLIPELRKAGMDGYDIGVFDERGKARRKVG